MSLLEKVKGDRSKILRRWLDALLDSFPKQSRLMISAESDRFSNPIGFTLHEAIDEVFRALVGEKTLEEIDLALGRLVKLKAIQEDHADGKLGALIELKRIIRESCGAYSARFSSITELLEIEDRVDEIILRAYQIYVQSREKILDLQINEIKNKTYMMRRMSGEA